MLQIQTVKDSKDSPPPVFTPIKKRREDPSARKGHFEF